MAQLRNEITEKEKIVEGLKDDSQKLGLAYEQLQRDYEKLKSDEAEKSKKLQVLSISYRTRKRLTFKNLHIPCVLIQLEFDFRNYNYLVSEGNRLNRILKGLKKR